MLRTCVAPRLLRVSAAEQFSSDVLRAYYDKGNSYLLRFRFRVSGNVLFKGFEQALTEEASKFASVGGYVRHSPYNVLEGEVSGARDDVDAVEQWLLNGPYPEGCSDVQVEIPDEGRFTLRQPLFQSFQVEHG